MGGAGPSWPFASLRHYDAQPFHHAGWFIGAMSVSMNAPPLPASILTSPRLCQWLSIAPETDRRITMYSGKVELGQGISNALSQIACEELGLEPQQLTLVAGHTAFSPDENYTAGSQSIEVGGAAIRAAAACAHALFARAAARLLGVAEESLRVDRGTFSSPLTAAVTDYWALAGEVDLAQAISPAPLRRRADYRCAGRSLPRADLPAKLSGAAYVHDLVLPGMLHARVLRGGHRACCLARVDTVALQALAGVSAVVHSGQFLAIVGADEEALVRALEQARKMVVWTLPEALPPQREIAEMLPALPCVSSVVHLQGDAAVPLVAHRARYSRPYLAHAAIGPSCAVADPAEGRLTVWSHTQGPHALRAQIAAALGRNMAEVEVIHMAGSGCYGHNGADDVAFDAAFIAQSIAAPVRVQWMREDEMSAAPCGSASLVEIAGGVDADGKICAWDIQIWSHTHIKRPGWGTGINLLGAWAKEPPIAEPPDMDVPLPAGGGQRNAIALYDLPHQQVTYHFIGQSPIRVSALRSLGAYANTFAIESFFDELAAKAAVDPLEFRLRHLADPRARAVILEVARRSGWQLTPPAGSGTGMGIGFGRYKNRSAYCAVVASVRVEEKVHVEKVWAVVDAGCVVNPDGLINQIEGGIIQSLSWTLKEAVTWSETGITSRTWEDYPILGFDEVPEVSVHHVDRIEEPSLGSGEAAAGPTAAAVGNAVAHALGIRARHLPLTAERLTLLINESS